MLIIYQKVQNSKTYKFEVQILKLINYSALVCAEDAQVLQ
jgi:hypothetical protein